MNEKEKARNAIKYQDSQNKSTLKVLGGRENEGKGHNKELGTRMALDSNLTVERQGNNAFQILRNHRPQAKTAHPVMPPVKYVTE
jgi:hypothetical protein